MSQTMTTEIKAGFKAMKDFKTNKDTILKRKRKFGKEVVKASKPFYKKMRLKKKAMSSYTKVMNQLNRKAKTECAKAARIKRNEQVAAERKSPEHKLRVMITKFALNILNTSDQKELLQYRGIGDATAMHLYGTRLRLPLKSFGNMKETELNDKQVKAFIEGIVAEKLLF
jgi:hypothetical protein